jgi:hypothetical protein
VALKMLQIETDAPPRFDALRKRDPPSVDFHHPMGRDESRPYKTNRPLRLTP